MPSILQDVLQLQKYAQQIAMAWASSTSTRSAILIGVSDVQLLYLID